MSYVPSSFGSTNSESTLNSFNDASDSSGVSCFTMYNLYVTSSPAPFCAVISTFVTLSGKSTLLLASLILNSVSPILTLVVFELDIASTNAFNLSFSTFAIYIPSSCF